MSGVIEYLGTDGTVTIVQQETAPSLEEMQKYVGGYIEVVNVLVDGKPMQMIVNEEGLIQELPVNVIASKHYATIGLMHYRSFPPTPICGNAILLRGIQLD